MTDQEKYLTELSRALSFHSEKDGILTEYEGHLKDMAEEENEVSYEWMIERLGHPEAIANLWREEITVTKPKLQWLFVCCNIALFIGGSLLTVAYHLFSWGWLEWTWNTLTSIPMAIIWAYVAFWCLLGYEIGKTFGPSGQPLLGKTFIIGMVPNLILMLLTVFHIIPHRWFAPLINQEFIWVCIIGTILLYPFTWFGFRFGRRMSV
ncbi:Uncharacterized membrane protein [Halobacillus karajensis]|uniref:Uncharacterized protein n=2 Tax=Halobacillus karajensis TaxID=195088 RepID=A0A024P8M9_9BACI|nr:membrane protein [Halobacillus karajensis]CDQ21560.1 hypothetical protein BN982_03962 [Halobacillus karajensis]CDQ25494.1 hypothetical protein BN983_03840 [Halobacillus karajensis]CDQ28975.1 hypothetical protein BN981_03319 [Halobacillus karajensis]SEI08964.1 Uncharacterized membrane protein [Halobacillus karajensis]